MLSQLVHACLFLLEGRIVSVWGGTRDVYRAKKFTIKTPQKVLTNGMPNTRAIIAPGCANTKAPNSGPVYGQLSAPLQRPDLLLASNEEAEIDENNRRQMPVNPGTENNKHQ